MELMWHNRQYVIESVSKVPKYSSCKESYSHDVLQKQGANIVPQASKINGQSLPRRLVKIKSYYGTHGVQNGVR